MTIWNPAEYARNSAAQLEWANEMLSRLHLKGSEAVLDLGCGDGKITRPWRTNSRGGGRSVSTIRRQRFGMPRRNMLCQSTKTSPFGSRMCGRWTTLMDLTWYSLVFGSLGRRNVERGVPAPLQQRWAGPGLGTCLETQLG